MRLGLILYCRKIVFEDEIRLCEEGPLLLACNHPNSFLDALIIGAYFKKPVHFLARGDAFKKPFAKKILTSLKVIPIYRLSEGKEYLALNDTTFERCTDVLMKGGIVLIFSEGLCINQWTLRPLKKGTARIALNAWKQETINTCFRILPVSLNYSSFSRFRKNVIIDFGLPINKTDIPEKPEGEQIIELNKLIFSRLEKGLIVATNNTSIVELLLSNFLIFKRKGQRIIQSLKTQQTPLKNDVQANFATLTGAKKICVNAADYFISVLSVLLLFIPALIGVLVHLPLYFPLNHFIKKKTEGTVFYHGALFGALVIAYPVYAFIISICLAAIYSNIAFLSCLLIMPFLASLFLCWRDSVEGWINFYKLNKSVGRNPKLH